jgi:uncharacterized hydrophobic protein (TIGR00271 family)
MGILKNIIDNNKFSPADIPAFEAKVFYEGTRQRSDLERFAVLLFLSTLIATYGVIGDSTATVIGAMIIAPLMRPIMATTAGLVMGNPKRTGLSFLVVVLGVIGVIVVSWLVTEITVTRVISFETNSQITSRTSPRLIDLYVALAAGAAGAFALSRDDVADSLPGVAMAIALVPPLCVVGIGLAQGEIGAASGAMLLFITNLLAILIAGGLVFALLGLNSATMKGLTREARRWAFLLIALSIMVVTIPLGSTSIRFFEENQVKRETILSTLNWLQGTGYGINQVRVAGDQVNLVIYGSGERPLLSELGNRLNASLDEPVDINLVVVPSTKESYVAERDK